MADSRTGAGKVYQRTFENLEPKSKEALWVRGEGVLGVHQKDQENSLKEFPVAKSRTI